MKITKLSSLFLAGCFLCSSLIGCAGGDGDNNGKEDNRNRKIWNENDRKQEKLEEIRKDSVKAHNM